MRSSDHLYRSQQSYHSNDQSRLTQAVNRIENQNLKILSDGYQQELTHICLYSKNIDEVFSLHCASSIGAIPRKVLQEQVMCPYPRYMIQQIVEEIDNLNQRPDSKLYANHRAIEEINSIKQEFDKQIKSLEKVYEITGKLIASIEEQREKLQIYSLHIPETQELLIEILEKVSEGRTHSEIEKNLKLFNNIRDESSQKYHVDENQLMNLFLQKVYTIDMQPTNDTINELRGQLNEIEASIQKFQDQFKNHQPRDVPKPYNPPVVQPQEQIPTTGITFNGSLEVKRDYSQFHDCHYIYEAQFLTDTLLGVMIYKQQRFYLEICDMNKNYEAIVRFDLGTHCTSWFQNFAKLNDNTLVYGLYQYLKIVDFQTGADVRSIIYENTIINCVHVFNEQTILTGDQQEENYQVTMFKLFQSNKPVSYFIGHENNIWQIEKIDARHFASASSDKTVRITDVQRIDKEIIIKYMSTAISVAVDGSGKFMFVGLNDGSLFRYEITPQLQYIEQTQVLFETNLNRIHQILPYDEEHVYLATEKGAQFVLFKNRYTYQVCNSYKISSGCTTFIALHKTDAISYVAYNEGPYSENLVITERKNY